jgi:hypothetical protein
VADNRQHFQCSSLAPRSRRHRRTGRCRGCVGSGRRVEPRHRAHVLARRGETRRRAAVCLRGEGHVVGGAAYRNGQGVTQDFVEAARWYRKASEQGRAQAQVNLGARYAQGYGVKQDYGEAERWYRQEPSKGLLVPKKAQCSQKGSSANNGERHPLRLPSLHQLKSRFLHHARAPTVASRRRRAASPSSRARVARPWCTAGRRVDRCSTGGPRPRFKSSPLDAMEFHHKHARCLKQDGSSKRLARAAEPRMKSATRYQISRW